MTGTAPRDRLANVRQAADASGSGRSRVFVADTRLHRRHRHRRLTAALLASVVFAAGCGRDNGLPGDLTDLLKSHDILVQPSRTHAPLSQRGGWLAIRYDAQVATGIISTFGLRPVPVDDPDWTHTAQANSVPIAAKEVWGRIGRPPQFKLEDGGQLEYLYLLVTPGGEMYVIAEYAYG